MSLAWWAVILVLFLALLLLSQSLRSGQRRGRITVLHEAAPSCVTQHPFTRSHYESLMAEHHQKQARLLPRFTERGWFLTSLPARLREGLVRAFQRKRSSSSHAPETDPSAVEFPDEATRPIMTDIEHTREEKEARAWLSTALQFWSGARDLSHSKTYGVRSYLRGSKLRPHVDRFRTHALSAIVHVSRSGLEEEWSLEVAPHDSDGVCSISMPKGADCLLYESASLPHGRLKPLRGDEYSNVFFHFRPRDWKGLVDPLGL